MVPVVLLDKQTNKPFGGTICINNNAYGQKTVQGVGSIGILDIYLNQLLNQSLISLLICFDGRYWQVPSSIRSLQKTSHTILNQQQPPLTILSMTASCRILERSIQIVQRTLSTYMSTLRIKSYLMSTLSIVVTYPSSSTVCILSQQFTTFTNACTTCMYVCINQVQQHKL